MAEQLSFDLPVRTALGRADFFVAPSNALAVAMIDADETWPSRKLLLTGDEGSGKTHLVHVWAKRRNAQVVAADRLTEDGVPGLAQTPVAVEDIPRIAGSDAAETALFHLHNLTLANGHPLLMTGRASPRDWRLSLPDLQSRIEGTQVARLAPPCDRLLAVLLAKLFTDRQIAPRPDVIPYLVRRMNRSFAEATRLVDTIDRASLSRGRAVTRDLVAGLLGDDAKAP